MEESKDGQSATYGLEEITYDDRVTLYVNHVYDTVYATYKDLYFYFCMPDDFPVWWLFDPPFSITSRVYLAELYGGSKELCISVENDAFVIFEKCVWPRC